MGVGKIKSINSNLFVGTSKRNFQTDGDVSTMGRDKSQIEQE